MFHVKHAMDARKDSRTSRYVSRGTGFAMGGGRARCEIGMFHVEQVIGARKDSRTSRERILAPDGGHGGAAFDHATLGGADMFHVKHAIVGWGAQGCFTWNIP